MFKNILGDLSKFLTRDKIIIVVALAILAYALFYYSSAKDIVMDLMEDGSDAKAQPDEKEMKADAPAPGAAVPSSGYAVQPIANPSELLPSSLPADQNSQWAALNPAAANPGAIAMPDLLQPGYHIGLDTIGQTLRNANLQLRSDPIIPKADVGPWMNSTIEPDIARVPLEIGYGAR
jgi:hypothetical protein